MKSLISKKAFVVIFLSFISFLSVGQTTSWKGTESIYWRTSENWTNGVPDATKNAIIGDANFTGANQPELKQGKGTGICKSITIGDGAIAVNLTLIDALEVSESIIIGANGTLTHSKSNISLSEDFLNSGSYIGGNKTTIRFTGTSQTIGGSSTTTIEKGFVEQGSTVTLGQNLRIEDDFVVEGKLDPTQSYTLSGAGEIELRGAGTLIVKASTFAGNYSHTGGLKFRSDNNTIDYASSTINQSVDFTIAYRNLRISGGLTKSLIGNILIGNAVEVAGGTLDIKTFTLDRGSNGGSFTVVSGATLKIGGTQTFPAKYSNIVLNASSTVNYYGGNQIVIGEDYGHLILSSSSGTISKTMPSTNLYVLGNFTSTATSGTLSFTAGNNLFIFGDTEIGANTTFNGATHEHVVKGDVVNEGTYTGPVSTFVSDGASSNWSGAGIFDLGTFISQGNTTLNANSSFSVAGDFTSSLGGVFTHTSGGSGLVSISGVGKSISGSGTIIFADLSVAFGSTVAIGCDVTIAGNLAVEGSLSDNANKLIFTGSAKTITGAGTLQFFEMNVPGTVSTAKDFSIAGDMRILGSFTATAGTASFNGDSELSGTASLYNITILNGNSLSNSVDAVLKIAGTDTLLGTGLFDGTSSVPNTVIYNGSGNQNFSFNSFHHLIFSNAGIKTPMSNLTINGDLTIDVSTTFEGLIYTHTIEGGWVNNGTFSAGTSTIELAGSKAVSVSGITTFNVLNINKASSFIEVLLEDDISTSTVNMTVGRVSTANNSLTITNTRTGNGIIIGTITRQHAFTTATDYAFEGPDNLINFSSITGLITAITVVIDNTTISSFPYRESIGRTYDISVTGGTAYTASLRLHYEDLELNGNDEAMMDLWNDQGTTSWIVMGSSSNDATANWVEQTSLSSLEDKWSLSDGLKVISWTGAVNSSISETGNWSVTAGSPNIPPTADDVVVFGDIVFTNQPNFNNSTTVKRVIFESNKETSLSIGTGNIVTIKGDVLGDWVGGAASHSINSGDATLDVEGNLEMGDGTAGHIIDLLVSTGTVSVSGNLIQDSGSDITFSGAGILNIGGDYDFQSGIYTAATSSIKYNGLGLQEMAGISYNDLSIDKSSGVARSNGNIQVSSNFDLLNGTLSLDHDLDVEGDINIAAGTTFNAVDNVISAASAVTINGTFNAESNAFTYDGESDQDVASTTYYDLIINKTAGIASLFGNINLIGDAFITNGTFDAGTYTITRTSAGGVATVSAGGTVLFGGGSTQVQNFASFVIDPTSTVHFYGTVARVIPPVAYGNLIISNGGANAKSLMGTTRVLGDLTVNTEASFSIDNNTLLLEGDLNVEGSMSTLNSFISLNGTDKEINFSSDFNNVEVNGSYDLISGDPSFVGRLEVTSTGDFDLGSATVEISGDFTNSGIATSTGTVTFLGTQVQTIRLLNAISSSSSGVVNFNGTVAPILSSTSSPQFATVNINNSDSIFASAPWTVAINMSIASGATFVGGNLTHTFLGHFFNSGAVTSDGLMNFNPIYFPSNIDLGSNFIANGEVYFGGTQAISLTDNLPNFSAVRISNTNASGITAGSDWTIANSFSVASGATFNAGSHAHTLSGGFLNEGTFNGETSTFTFDGIDYTIAGNEGVTFNDLVFDTGAELEIVDGIAVAGDFTNNATILDLSSANVDFTGSNLSVIGGTSPVFNELTVNKSAGGLRLNTDITVSSTLTMTAGVLDLNDNELNITNVLSSAVSRTSGTINSESTNNTGKVNWTINTDTDPHTIPFGSPDNTYIPFIFDLSSGNAGIVSVSTYQTANDNTPYPTGVTDMVYPLMDNSGNVADRFFQIDLAGESSPVANILLSVTPTEAAGLTGLEGQRWDGSEWLAPLPDQVNVGESVNIPNVSEFSPWILSGTSGPLPIELVSFEVRSSDFKAVLEWKTAAETNNKGFDIQRSVDGKSFETIGNIDGATNSNELISYNFIDSNPIEGKSYYRLKQIDFDGQFEVSVVRSLQIEKELIQKLYLYPNPLIGNNFSVKMEGVDSDEVLVSIVHISGRVVYENSFEVPQSDATIIVKLEDKLPAGIYLVKCKSSNKTIQEKLVIAEM